MKFSIRELLLVTVIVALALGWWVDRRLLKKQLVPIEFWRGRANSFENAFTSEGWRISQEGPVLWLTPPKVQGKRMAYTYDTRLFNGPHDSSLPISQGSDPDQPNP
jgi:hypothetical protein